ncbi:MAG: tRNA pseudouridine(38-40) synthase TruA [Thermoplasmata archaeon]|nr:MAG: tRNA pseudouridine(38-40) synthase TruA [Thermoplasmata archaeon]KAA0013340.1 MAG: tRNA pseudouridine(38-40) synthase TruA [Thermoplasmata archaeon]OYT61539.1 MAG: tRNA pseudouridine(38-40) synthase TruA [Thermoplasmatales archaeon ex4484_30]
MRIAIKIGYDGTKFYGFARQPNRRTVEGEIIRRLRKAKIIGEDANFQYAARTDRGVSAFENVIAFNCKGDAVNVLKNMDDIWLTGYAIVDKNFNPRYCKKKIYRYYLYNKGYDISRMKKAVKLFEGKHDFSYFAKRDGRNPVMKIDRVSVKGRKIIKFDFEGKYFLWNQIRRIMGAIIKAGKGADIEKIKEVLEKKKRINFGLAPAENLVLLHIEYNFSFTPIIPEKLMIKKEIFKDASTIIL